MKRLAPIPDPWSHDSTRRVRPYLWPHAHGDGLNRVQMSFYECPEVVIHIPVDSALPLALDSNHPLRYRERPEGGEIVCFRDLLDDIYTGICLAVPHSPEYIPVPRYRMREIRAEWRGEPDDPFADDESEPYQTAWELITSRGSTWNYAKSADAWADMERRVEARKHIPIPGWECITQPV